MPPNSNHIYPPAFTKVRTLPEGGGGWQVGSGEDALPRPHTGLEMSPHGQGERKDLANPAHVGHFIPAFFRECLEFSHTWSFGFPCGAGGKEPACQGRRCKSCRFDPWVGKTSWKRKMTAHSSILA